MLRAIFSLILRTPAMTKLQAVLGITEMGQGCSDFIFYFSVQRFSKLIGVGTFRFWPSVSFDGIG
jgi:hypothetical protein